MNAIYFHIIFSETTQNSIPNCKKRPAEGAREARPFVDEANFYTFVSFFAIFSLKMVLIVSYICFKERPDNWETPTRRRSRATQHGGSTVLSAGEKDDRGATYLRKKEANRGVWGVKPPS